jgi:hypothetical protein
MPRWFKNVVGTLLLPGCASLAIAVVRVVESSGRADAFWVAFLAGVACWLVVYLLMPRPMWVYVWGHELTHVLWTWLFGGRVTRFKATAKKGSVRVTRNNFLISLAPYFFPIYVWAVVLFYAVVNLFWPLSTIQALFHLLIGAAYAFHLTLTGHILKTRQTDLTDHGLIFSLVIIWLGNLITLLVGLPFLTQKIGWSQAFLWWFQETLSFFHRFCDFIR